MSNVRYAYANERFLTGQIDWLTDTFKVILVDTNRYVVAPSVDRHLSDVPAEARIAVSSALTGKTAFGGVAKADNVTVTTVMGQTIQALVIYRDTGTASTSELIAYLDTASGLPFTPQGVTAVIRWDTGTNGIFRL